MTDYYTTDGRQYILVRADLSPEQKMVQASHAAAVAAEQIYKLRSLGQDWIPKASVRTHIILQVRNKYMMHFYMFYLRFLGYKVFPFYEDDSMENEITSLSFFAKIKTYYSLNGRVKVQGNPVNFLPLAKCK